LRALRLPAKEGAQDKLRSFGSKRGNPVADASLDCFASLAMTLNFLSLQRKWGGVIATGEQTRPPRFCVH
jgi:hypothetical protein